MASHNLTNAVKTIRALAPVAAGTSAQNTSGIDTRGYEGIRFVASFGTITSGAALSVKLQQSDDDGSADDYTDLTGTNIASADTDDNTLVISDIYRPQKRYVRMAITRATQNAVIDLVLAELYRPAFKGVTKDATVSNQEMASSVAEGTA